MAIVQKALRFIYQSKNSVTGLTDVKAQIYVNGVAKAAGANAITATANTNGSKVTEISSANMPGVYEVYIAAADLTAFGIVAGTYSALEAVINSATAPLEAIFRQELTVANTDDVTTVLGTPATSSIAGDVAAVQTKLGTPAGASVSADILTANTAIAAVKADLETASSSLPNILAAIQSLQNASIGNGVGFVLPTLLIPASGSNTYLIPITIQDSAGALVDASSGVTVGVKNSAGVDRGSFLTGSTGSPATAAATHVSTGQYTAQVVIPSSEVEEELIFSFSYTVSGNSIVRFGVAQTLDDDAAEGGALQSTLLATQTTVNAINSIVSNGTYGNAAIQALLANGTYGLAALQALLTNSTYGLAALQTIEASNASGIAATNSTLGNGTYGLAALQAQGAATQGSGFTAGTDDLHSLSAFIRANLNTGGRAF